VAAFATVDELAEYTRKAIDSDAAVVSASRLLDVASAAIRSYCRQSFDLVTGDVVVLDDRAGLPGVLLPELPVLAVTSVETLSDGTWTALAADGFEWDSYGRVWLTGKAPVWWPRLTRSVRGHLQPRLRVRPRRRESGVPRVGGPPVHEPARVGVGVDR
jgi:hypothetical protein